MKSNSTYSWFRGIASLLLLLGYFLNVVSFESFHHAVHHHHHAELHSEEAEADACHRAIYHGETSHECEHKSHLAATHDSCELCKVTVSRFHYTTYGVQAANHPFVSINSEPTQLGVVCSNHATLRVPRGPPLFS